MSTLGMTRDEFYWLFPYAELILCFMANGEKNGTTYKWETFDMQIEVMDNLKKIREGKL
jgi:hypothetical protein